VGSHKILPEKFKRKMITKFGMKKYSLNPIAPNEHDLEFDYLAKERFINIE
jgi:hypothetical protein